MKKKKKKKFSFQKRNKKKVLKNETIYSYALACFTKLIHLILYSQSDFDSKKKWSKRKKKHAI
jgi:hypothetical protein